MPGITLKYYSEYIDRIIAYIEAHNMKLEYKVHDNEGTYIPAKRLIRIDPDMSDSQEIATLLHELGHTLDDSIVQGKMESRICLAYNAFYKNKASRSQKDLVIETETRAWRYGKVVAKNLRIRLGKWYDKEAEDALATYRGEVR